MSAPVFASSARPRNKHQGLTAELRQRILSGAYSVGAKLPSIRQLSAEFGLSTATVSRSVQELAREGLVACHASPSGTVILRKDAAPCERTTLACLLRPHRPRNESDNFGLDMIQGLRDEISARGFRFVYHCFDEADYEGRMARLGREPWVAGMVLDSYATKDTLARLAGLGLPAVLLNRHEVLPGLSCVAPDWERCGRQSLNMLLDNGCRRVGFYPSPDSPGFHALQNEMCIRLLAGFTAAARGRGLATQDLLFIPEVLPKDPILNQPAHFGLPVSKPRDWAPLGLCVGSDMRARQIVEVIAKTDLVLGRDIHL
ncbi:MAG TPA: GntR family transcriptional regulator, partial [Candidatus Brocadiia bacterium]|nr:GntR family transcriptional regulator [Candidatus Brocadiia bacterium]